VLLSAGGLILRTVTAQTVDSPPAAVLLTTENIVDIAQRNAAWAPATAGQTLNIRERLRTGEDSRGASPI